MPGPTVNVLDIGGPSLPAVQLFNDTFDTAVIDTVNRWLPPVSVVPSIGSVTLSPTNVSGAVSQLISLPVFRPTEPGFLFKVSRINIEFPVLLTAHRFWGLGTSTNYAGNSSGSILSPTVSNPIVDGLGFEIRTDGKLYASVYATGSRVFSTDLSVQTGTKQQPVDSNAHKYYIFFRGDLAFWSIDDTANVVASYQTGAFGPNVNSLPAIHQVVSVGGGTPATIVLNGVNVSDTSRTTTTLADGAFGWRKQSITAGGAALVQTVSGSQIGILNPAGTADILRSDGAGRLTDSNEDLLRQLIREVRLTNRLLIIGLGVDSDLDANSDTDYD